MAESVNSAFIVGIVLAVVVTPLGAGVAVPVGQNQDRVLVGQTEAGSSIAQENGTRVQQFSVESATLRNVTATDVVVRELTVRRTSQRRNVTLRNVTVERLTVRRASVSDARVLDAVIRDEELLSEFGFHYARGTNVTNESRQSVSIQNRTLDGVLIERLAIRNAAGLNVSAPTNATSEASLVASEADLVIGNADVRSVASVRGFGGNRTDAS